MPFPIDERFIVETENRLGVKFPESFRNKMKEINGGSIESNEDSWELFPFLDTTDKKRISRTCNNIFSETQKEKQNSNFPQNAISIGSNSCGDILIFLKRENHDNVLDNPVYWWDHENGEILKIAEDFSNLL